MINNPPYYLTDIFAEISQLVKAQLSIPVLNYKYGYLSEIKEDLIQDSRAGGSFAAGKYPMLWLVQPFTITRSDSLAYGVANGLELFIINGSQQEWKAPQRMENNYKPVIDPIYYALMNQVRLSKYLNENTLDGISHRVTDRYYWGKEQQEDFINDIFDCKHISGLVLTIKNKSNC